MINHWANHNTTQNKEDTLEQINAIASALQNPQDGTVKKGVKKAMTMLRGITAALPTTT